MATVKITPTNKEIGLIDQMFRESAYMGGTNIDYYAVDTKDITKVSSEFYTWKEPINMDIIYDQRPKVSLLKRLNWYREDSAIQPRIVYIPSTFKGESILARRGDLIRVSPDGTENNENNLFQISEVRTDLVKLYYICNITPYREQLKPTGTGVNNRWLNR